MSHKFINAVILLFYFTAIGMAKIRTFNVVVHNVTCNSFTNRIELFECQFSQLSAGIYNFNTHLMFNRPLDKEVDVRVLLQLRMTNGGKQLNFIDVKVNLCEALSQTFSNVLLKILMDEFRRTSNLPYGCPMKGKFMYKVENYTIADKTLPAYTPLLDSTFAMELYEKKQMFGSYVIEGSVVPK